MATDRPKREIPKEYREVVVHLIDVQGWRYNNQRKGHPMLFPLHGSRPIPVPTTPSANPRAWQNWLAQIRRAGGQWPPERRRS